MNQSGDTPSPENANAPVSKTSVLSRVWGYVFLVLLIVAFVGIAFIAQNGRWLKKSGVSETVAVQSLVKDTTDGSRIAALEDQSRRVQQRVDDLMARLEKLEKAEPSTTNATSKEETDALEENVTRLRNDMMAMSGALESLQAQLKQATQNAEQTRSASQSQVALAVAFVQIKAVAASGESFERELDILKKAGAHDAAVSAAVVQLEPLAAKGALAYPELRDHFRAVAGSAQAALRRATAQNWKERLLAELKSLISIRSLYSDGGESDVFAAIEKDLTEHRLKDALEKINGLPEPVQAVLKDWRAKVEARQNLDNALNVLAIHLTSPSTAPEHHAPEPAPVTGAPS